MISNDNLSKTIDCLRFPLIMVVCLAHVGPFIGIPEMDQLEISRMLRLFVESTGSAAVALFAFISGFLFFRNFRSVRKSYPGKMESRAKSLLVPYLFWNAWMLVVYFLVQTIVPSMAPKSIPEIASLGFLDYLQCFWEISRPSGPAPICPQFWFLRDLMVAIVLSPIIYWCAKYLKKWNFLILLAVPFLFQEIRIGIYFLIGAYFAVNNIDFAALADKWKKTSSVFSILFCVVLAMLHTNLEAYWLSFSVAMLVFIMAVIGWTHTGVRLDKFRPNALLTGSTFFIFALHNVPVQFFNRLYNLVPPSALSLVAGYVVIFVATVAVCIAIWLVLRKLCPGFLRIICGGR